MVFLLADLERNVQRSSVVTAFDIINSLYNLAEEDNDNNCKQQ